MDGVTSEMRRILDIDKLQEREGRRLRRIKNGHAKVAQRKEKEARASCRNCTDSKSREYNISDIRPDV